MILLIEVKDTDNVIGLKEDIAMRLEGVADIERIDVNADVVKVVRCKDCKHCVKYKCKNDACYSFTICRRDGCMVDAEENDFCSYGERKEK